MPVVPGEIVVPLGRVFILSSEVLPCLLLWSAAFLTLSRQIVHPYPDEK
jgi:hypothetical protein